MHGADIDALQYATMTKPVLQGITLKVNSCSMGVTLGLSNIIEHDRKYQATTQHPYTGNVPQYVNISNDEYVNSRVLRHHMCYILVTGLSAMCRCAS